MIERVREEGHQEVSHLYKEEEVIVDNFLI